MAIYIDGPASHYFNPAIIRKTDQRLHESNLLSSLMIENLQHTPEGTNICNGIPFTADTNLLFSNNSISVSIEEEKAAWIIFLHTTDQQELTYNEHGIISPMKGEGFLGETAAEYTVVYKDGEEITFKIQRRIHIGMFSAIWGENCIQAVPFRKQKPMRAHHEQENKSWGVSQTRVDTRDRGPWTSWLWAWKNPRKEIPISGFTFESPSTAVVISGITFGSVEEHPLRWESRKKACLTLPEGELFNPEIDKEGALAQIKLDLGQIISAQPRLNYPLNNWENSYNNKLPVPQQNELIVEYTAHPKANFHLLGGRVIPAAILPDRGDKGIIRRVKSSEKRVAIKVIDGCSGLPVPVKIHIHGEEGEYLAPLDRHRIPNNAWFEDYSPDFVHAGLHRCTYIDGTTTVDLPLGRIYVEISKGFEIRPIRKTLEITGQSDEIIFTLDKILPWREAGWVTADTHVHFLSPSTALLEGSAEGVNVVNLLASQWGELMTNVGDFDGRTTHGAKDFGGNGEFLVRVGTENRQHIMGHISLLGYNRGIISPLCTGGPDESAIGDPIEVLLTEWGRQCRQQEGLAILPHFPNPRLEGAAAIIDGSIDGIEMTSWGNLYNGINPYSLSDWYRYLNCGYFTPAVGGTDKMSSDTPVGAVRTYAQVKEEFTYDSWKEAVRAGRTFVTYGPLLNFTVDGAGPGSSLNIGSGGKVEVEWEARSVTVPMSRIDLVVNGEIRESLEIDKNSASGHWEINITRSSWLALLVRGNYSDKPEIIAAHSSPIAVNVMNSRFYSELDAVTILEQIEGALAFVETIGTRADEKRYKEMLLVLTGAHRKLHNRMHIEGKFHEHNILTDHDEHHS